MIHEIHRFQDTPALMEVLERSQVLHLAFTDEAYPYVIPLNYGAVCEDGQIVIYLHWASLGRKLELYRSHPEVGFSASWFQETESPKVHCVMRYQSVVGGGVLSEVVTEEEKVKGLNILLAHYGKRQLARYSEALFKDIRIMKLSVVTITGKEIPE